MLRCLYLGVSFAIVGGAVAGATVNPDILFRHLTNEEVVLSQKKDLKDWQRHCNDGDPESISRYYATSSMLHVRFGPAGKQFASYNVGLADGDYRRGVAHADEILRFWNMTLRVGGLSKMMIPNDEDTQVVVINDNKVVVSAPLLFEAAKGRIFAQQWERDDGHDRWLITFDMFEIEDITSELVLPEFASTVASTQAPLKGPPAAPDKSEHYGDDISLFPRVSVNNKTAARTAIQDSTSTGIGYAKPVLAVIASCVVLFLVRKYQKRQDITQSVEAKAMLG